MNVQPTPQPGRVRLTDEQLKRLEAAIIRRPSRRYIDRDGITRWTMISINEFVHSLVKFYHAHGYLTERQYARVADFLQEPQA